MPNGDWNIFIRELEDTLKRHGGSLGQLHSKLGIHPQKMDRFRKSLKGSKSFPVLNPEEMEAVIAKYELKAAEVIHLRAALLVTAIEEMLVDRIELETAFYVSEHILDTLSHALARNNKLVTTFEKIRGEQDASEEAEALDPALDEALATMDRATKALALSAVTPAQKQTYARQAGIHFEAALAQLDQASAEIQATEEWQFWHNEALSGLQAAKQTLSSEP